MGISATEHRGDRPGWALLASLRLLEVSPIFMLTVLSPNTNATITCLLSKTKMLQKYHIKNESSPSSHSQKVSVVIHMVNLDALIT